jgi:hypothetical protein
LIYREKNSSYGIYQCSCGASKSSRIDEYSTERNPYGDITIFSIPYNLGDAYSYCNTCKKYWYDGNAKEWNELTFSKKFFYAIGFWNIVKLAPPWLVFQFVSDMVSKDGSDYRFIRFFQYIYWTIFGIPFFIIYDLFLIFLTLLINIPFMPFVIIFHAVEIHASIKRIKNGSPNKSNYYQQKNNIQVNKIFPWM